MNDIDNDGSKNKIKDGSKNLGQIDESFIWFLKKIERNFIIVSGMVIFILWYALYVVDTHFRRQFRW